MGMYITVILLTAVLFLTMILMLAVKPRFAGRMTGAFLVIAGLGGLFFYGYGFSEVCGNLPEAVIRALLGVCGMFVAKMDLSSISAAPLMQYTWAKLLFWIVHLLALYSTASAAITTVGAEALRKLRLWLARWGKLNLIYGVSPESIDLGRKLIAGKEGSVVFVDGKPDPGAAAAIAKIGCVLRSDESALKADGRFLRAVGGTRKNRKITLYAMDAQETENLRYATDLLASLKACGAGAEQTGLVIRGREESSASSLQVLGSRYGYGFVTVFREEGLAARLLIRQYPPCDAISFDADGRAKEDFEAVLIGFGQTGQAVLRNLVMNGQFEGSTFRAAVFSPNCNAVNGYFSRSFPQVLEHYDISFHPHDGRSTELYDHLLRRGERIRYLVISVGSEGLNQEIAGELSAFFGKMGWKIPIYLCSHQGVREYSADASRGQFHGLYRPEVLSMGGIDRMAMVVNHHYQGDSDRGALAEWMDCDYFSRMSCRATADFIPAVLRMAGKTEAQALSGGWSFTPEQLENLSRTEHLRWCAFHYCMGFRPMSREEYDRRAELHQQQKAMGIPNPIRIGKDMEKRTHACLVDWEELEELSRRESAIMGKPVNYWSLDSENVLVLPKLLQAAKNEV